MNMKQSQDSTHSIITSAKRFFSGTALSRITGLAREVTMAVIFGTNPLVAAFWMAFRFSSLLRRLFGEGALHAVFVPHFEMLKKQDSLLGARFFYDLSMGVSCVLLAVIVFVEALLGGILLFCPISLDNVAVIRLTMLMMPSIVFISLYALNTSLLNCERSFFIPSVAPTALNLVWILSVFFVCHRPRAIALEYLAMLIVVAFIFQWMVTLPQVWRYLLKELGNKWQENAFSGKEIFRIMRPFALGIIGVTGTQINSAVDAIFARTADLNGPAYLWYALRIQQLPLALLGVALTGALLPPITRAIQNKDLTSYLHFLNFSLKKMIVLLIPVTVALFALGFSGMNLVYGHGAFSHKALYETTRCLWAYGGALLPMSVVLMLASAFYGHKNYLVPTTLVLITVALNLILNALFVFLFQLATISIALATTLSTCINGFFLAHILKRKYGLDTEGLGRLSVKVGFASVIALIATLFLGAFCFKDNTLLWLMHKELVAFPKELHTQLIVFVSQAACFSVTFILAAYWLGIQEFVSLMQRFLPLRKIFHRG